MLPCGSVTDSVKRGILQIRYSNFVCEAKYPHQEKARISGLFQVAQFLRIEPFLEHFELFHAVFFQIHAPGRRFFKGTMKRLFKVGAKLAQAALVKVEWILFGANVNRYDRAVKAAV